MKNLILFVVIHFCINSIYTYAQFEFQDYFDSYIPNQQLACQNPIDWTTWSNQPCNYPEDPYLSTNYAHTWQNSVRVIQWNDLIKLLGNFSTGRNHITFYAYIPNGKSGYFGLLSKFSPDPNELAFSCFFDVGGTGRLMNIPGEPILFDYTYNQWHLVWVVVDFDLDEAQFYLDYELISIWNWTQNGTITGQIAAHNFYGPNTTNEMYIDDYYLFENNCLSCFPPTEPTNFTAQQIFITEPNIQLNWQPSIYWSPRAYKIIRKIGYPSTPTDFETLAYVPFNELQYVDSNIVIDSTYTYGVLALNMYGYSDTSNFATITVEPVPVDLVSFTSDIKVNNVQLNWTTATEINNKGFEILRSAQNDNDWVKIGFVNGHGTTTEPQFYSLIDESLQPGKYQYRLKQIDFDGSFEYSKIVEVTIPTPIEFSLSQNYPNPFNPVTSIQYAVSSMQFVTLKVYDVLGNEVATLVNGEKPAGEYEVVFDATGLSSGIYFYILKVPGLNLIAKMIYQK